MPLDRRKFLKKSAVTGAGVALAGTVATPAAEAAPEAGRGKKPVKRYALTVMGTTDLHGHVFNWDYYKDAEYQDPAGNAQGLARVSTLVNRIRKERGRENTLLLDAGDTIQGTPLTYYYAKVDPITAEGGPVHPMAQAMNAIGYDAVALGNHEFNYGIETLRKFEEQCDFPLLGANAVDAKTLKPAFPPYFVKTFHVKGAPPVKVAVLGLTNPGIAIWDKAYVQGKLTFPGLEEQAAKWVPKLRSMGADVVIVSAHSGTSGTSSYGDQLPHVENAAANVARQVPGIDAILVGHAHAEIAELRVTNEKTGKEVVLSEPLCYAERLTLFDVELTFERGRWQVESVRASLRDAATVEDDPRITRLLGDEHAQVVAYVNQVVGTATETLTTVEARYKDAPIIDLISKVQEDVVRDALAGTEYASLPVLSQASPFSRTSEIPAGDVTIRDLSSLYVYDNTLVAKLLTGAQVRAYLEYSAEYFVQTAAGAPVDVDKLTNANGRPDYNYDYVSGVRYDIDIAQPAGSRIKNLTFDGAPVDDAQQFVFAVNNYRANGGGAFPHVASAPELWAESTEIRTRIAEWATAKGVLDPKDFASEDWRLTRDGTPVF
ncbi:5'-nucleotidase C-terminal domain-containing protein [Streptomyces cellulosae]|jgi:2',3'-cyclic-nucleotide 2'-phosphodiesterase/3'-nucleotidase|uniref:5'-nucleotidase C-terminal domain-containing protein n=2 Tax=Streptomyces TaxID=1883 RepID=A0ABU3J8Z0_9ACTN|nr:twin-arginine translocation signal domain-containing protein [Streptomyces sp. McG7]MDQ0488478.1 2',3'-cyclic-nucleotide 2'-phosphodiesterase/3'-nucleotidase [Streptomyces thermodiastaticus]MDT6971529.1 5'-nucleotidase C-terminal domain-containing protein [Streptomyces thermocarboxydus]MXQ57214.1 twin-arginine translocation signal domain-containing protein [Streptomyces sp. XHT-2]WSB40913.1 5'-nucleotidase C-terminal domain-containing protein [Streptomyces cellulosae]